MHILKTKLEDLKNFDLDLTSILSEERLKSYNGNIEQHYKNRLLALEVGNKIANLEIYLRNKLDFCLSLVYGKNWIKEEKALSLIKPKGKTPLEELKPHQILSSLMLGEVVDLIRTYGIESYMFDLKSMDFKKYDSSNKNTIYTLKRKRAMRNIEKNRIVLNLIRNIRNRAFHWENLYKVRIEKDGTIYPRITHKENGAKIGILPDKILIFLDDLIQTIGNPEMEKYRDLEIKYRET